MRDERGRQKDDELRKETGKDAWSDVKGKKLGCKVSECGRRRVGQEAKEQKGNRGRQRKQAIRRRKRRYKNKRASF